MLRSVSLYEAHFSLERLRIWVRAGKIDVALMLNSSNPKPSSIGIAIGSPAISPHMPAHLPSRWAASITLLIKFKIAGLYGWYKSLTRSFIRSRSAEHTSELQ